MSAHDVTRAFERELCEYTGARFAVAVNSCTSALLLACAWHIWHRQPFVTTDVEIPARTYCSVPMSIIHAGGTPKFRDEGWTGAYQLKPYPIWDSARRFYAGMYGDFGAGDEPVGGDQFVCVSFHAAKILGDTQGGAILHDDPVADAWLRRARFDGRAEGVAPIDDDFTMVGWHVYMSNDVAARLLNKLAFLPRDNADLPNDDYPDLSKMEIFR